VRTQTVELPYFPPLESHQIFEVINNAFDKVNLNCNKDVLIIVDDMTRPNTGIPKLVLDKTIEMVGMERVVVVVASGLHRACSYQETIVRLGDNIKKVRLYTHNPMTSPSSFLDKNNFIIGINTVLPHLLTEFTTCGKLICPGLKNFNHAVEFHTVQGEIARLWMESHKINFDIGFDVYINANSDVVHFSEQDMSSNKIHKEYYEVEIPEISNVAILRPAIKKMDFQQTMNVLNIMKYSPLVGDGGTICITSDTPEGMGVHYLFQQPNGIRPVKYDETFKSFFIRKNIACVFQNINRKSVQEYFNRAIAFFHNWGEFYDQVEYLYGKSATINIFYGADMMAGKTNE